MEILPFLLCLGSSLANTPPHIVFILADDLGVNDVGWRNPQIVTPNLDSLARDGVVLEQHYAQFQCTPSRSALMTSRYPYKYGRQRGVLRATQPTGLSLDHPLLPQYLQDVGYITHLLGKWHLGFCHPAYLPTSRGFHSHYGFWNAEEDYWSKRALDWENFYGYDFHENLEITREPAGIYSTEVYAARAEQIIRFHNTSSPMFLLLAPQSAHTPLEAPDEYLDMFAGVHDHNRRVFSAMVAAMDVMVGRVIGALRESGLYENSLVVFVSDNGAATMQGGSNWPLRGEKATVWEGGTRVPAFLHSPLLSPGTSFSGLMHIVDWVPTLLSATGKTSQLFNQTSNNLDGVSLWNSLLEGQGAASPRTEVVYNIDNVDDGEPIAALRQGDWKLVQRPSGTSDWIEEPGISPSPTNSPRPAPPPPVPTNATYLFNLAADPEERIDLSSERPDLVQAMVDRVRELAMQLVEPDNPGTVWDGNPALTGWEWTTGWCNISASTN